MKIDYLSFSKIPSRDANSINVMNMCNAFANNGHTVTLYAKKGEPSSLNPYEHYGVSRSFKLRQCMFPKLKILGDIVYGIHALFKILSAPKPDLYFGRHPYLLVIAALRRVPIIYDSHDVPQSWIRRYIENLIFTSKMFSTLSVTSNISKKEYTKIFPHLSSKNIVVARNGASLPNNKDVTSIPHLPGRKNTINVGYTGHLYPGRGMNIIYDLANELKDTNFHIIGGNEKDIQKWHSKNKPPNLYFHGYVPHRDIHSFLTNFDIVLAPYQKKVTIGGGKGDTSRWMCPLKIFGYMAAKKPIIASKLPALEEILINDSSAILVDPENTKAWINAVKRLQSSTKLRNKLAANAYETLKANYTWDKRARLVLSNFE